MIDLHQYKGKLIIHTGSMFSGKTSSLKKDVNRFNMAGYKTLAFKPQLDIRFDQAKIISHDNTSVEAKVVNNINKIVHYCKEYKPDVIAIDEVQFLEDDIDQVIKSINEFLSNNITVIVAGLDMDFSGKPFEIMKELMPLADYLYKHHAVCVSCGSDGWVSHRKTKNKERVVIGSSQEYEPLCRSCYLKEKEKEEALVNKNQVSIDDIKKDDY